MVYRSQSNEISSQSGSNCTALYRVRIKLLLLQIFDNSFYYRHELEIFLRIRFANYNNPSVQWIFYSMDFKMRKSKVYHRGVWDAEHRVYVGILILTVVVTRTEIL